MTETGKLTPDQQKELLEATEAVEGEVLPQGTREGDEALDLKTSPLGGESVALAPELVSEPAVTAESAPELDAQEDQAVDPELVAKGKGSVEAKQLVRDRVEEMRSRARVVEEEREELKKWEIFSEYDDLIDQYLILDEFVRDLEVEVKDLESKLEPRPSTGGLLIERELYAWRKLLIEERENRDGIENIIPKELLEKLQKVEGGEAPELVPEPEEALDESALESKLPETPVVAETPEPSLEIPTAEAEALESVEPELVVPETPGLVSEPEAPAAETIEEVKQRVRGEMKRFTRIKSPEAFGSVLKNMTDYVHFLEGNSKNKFVEFATRFVKDNLDLVGESADGIPEDLRDKEIKDIPEDAKKDSWWTLIFFLLELGLATSETVVNEAVTAINE